LTEGEEYTHERGKIDTLQIYIRERFRLMDKVVAIRRDGAEDKIGEKRRVAMARKLMNQIDSTSMELQQMLERESDRSKAESKESIRENRRVNHAIALLGGIIAALLGVLVYKDFQEREKIEQKLHTLNNQKSQFFSIISHDLRGPTRNTKVLLEMMNDPSFATSPEEAKKMAGMAVESAQQTHRLLEDLLTWGRLQMDQVGIVTTKFKPFESAENVCGALQATARLKNISIHNQIPRHLKVRADVNMVETVIRNLVSNAIKFTPENGQVQIKAREAGSYVELVVEDNGVGIVPEVVEKIFTFHTKHTTRGTAGEAGTGLGLAFCREFVERNGGTISVESYVGIGSKFNVRLPLADLRESA
jgi:signal transduction histidine kinase